MSTKRTRGRRRATTIPSRASPSRDFASWSRFAARRDGPEGQRSRERPPKPRTSPAFTYSTSSGPPSARPTAASAGPTVNPRSANVPKRAVAGGSFPSSTSEGRAASAAGVKSAVPAPATSASATVASKLSTSAIPVKAPARRRSATTQHVRREKRSAIAPKTGPRAIAGRRSAISTAEIAQEESSRSKAIRSRATYAAPFPNDDWARAAKKTRARRSCLRSSIASRTSPPSGDERPCSLRQFGAAPSAAPNSHT